VKQITLSRDGGHELARAIMTTDTVPKEAAVKVEEGGYINALSKNLDIGVNILTTTYDYCLKKGLSVWRGFPVMVTAPAGAFVGTVGGSGYFLGKSVYDMFKKGENVLALFPIYIKKIFVFNLDFSPPPQSGVPYLGFALSEGFYKVSQSKKESWLKIILNDVINIVESFSPIYS